MHRADSGPWLPRIRGARPGVLAALAGLSTLAAMAASAQSLPRSLVHPAAALPPSARAELQRHRAELAAMDQAQRDDFRQRIAQWDAQAAALKHERRIQWQAWQALPETERMRMQQAADGFMALPADQQQALRARYEALDASEQRGWHLGPTLGAVYPKLHALFAQVPVDQRDATLAALRAMSDDERETLAVLAQRTPPQERDALRRRWLSLPEPQRAAWLQAQAGR